MEHKEINISDKVSIADNERNIQPAKGIIKIYNENNELIKEIHNMIVLSGRKYLFDLFKNSVISETNTETKKYNLYMNFSYMDNYVQTTSDLTLSDIQANNPIKIKIDQMNPAIDNSDALSIVLKATINGSENFQKMNQIYLTIEPETPDEKILFSRAGLDPIFLGNNGKYTLSYTLYF